MKILQVITIPDSALLLAQKQVDGYFINQLILTIGLFCIKTDFVKPIDF